MEITLMSDLVSTLVDAGLVEGLLDKKGPWVMLGVFDVCGLLGRNYLDWREGCPAVLSRVEIN